MGRSEAIEASKSRTPRVQQRDSAASMPTRVRSRAGELAGHHILAKKYDLRALLAEAPRYAAAAGDPRPLTLIHPTRNPLVACASARLVFRAAYCCAAVLLSCCSSCLPSTSWSSFAQQHSIVSRTLQAGRVAAAVLLV